MIILYRKEDDDRADDIQTALDELVVAYRVETVRRGAPLPARVTSLPAIAEGDRVIAGGPALDAYLRELAAWMAEWRKYQTDACYIGEDGDVC